MGLGQFGYFVKNLEVMKEPRRSPHSGVAGVRGVTDAAAAARASAWRKSGTTQPTTAGAQTRARQRTVSGSWRQWLSGATLLVAASASNAALIDRGTLGLALHAVELAAPRFRHDGLLAFGLTSVVDGKS
jgi:hypothetical protein